MIFFDSQKFLTQLIQALDQAQSTIEIEVYIWDVDPIGQQLEDALIRAAKRGVKARVIVDRVGAFEWINRRMDSLVQLGVEVRVFRPLLGLRTLLKYSTDKLRFVLGAVNRRDHRKVFTIDRKIAFVGSFNFSEDALAWKETVIQVDDPKDIKILTHFFEYTWVWIKDENARFQKYDSETLITEVMSSETIRTTQIKKLRSHYRRDFLHRVMNAEQRIWFVTPYFNAPRFFLKALVKAAKRGVDVRLMVPKSTDPIWFSYLSRLYYAPLVQRGLKIYEYQPSFIHAKTALIDSSGMVGSGNLNYRSFYQDLELNIIVTKPEDVDSLHEEFIKDMASCHQIAGKEDLRLWERMFGHFLTVFKTSF